MNLEKKIYLYWIKIGCSLVLKNDSRKTWKLGKKERKKKKKKNSNQSFTVSHPIKNNNNKLVSFTDEKLKTFHSHCKFLSSDSSGYCLSKDF